MSLGMELGGRDGRRRRRARAGFFKTVIFLILIGAISYWSYSLGQQRSGTDNQDLREQIAQLRVENTRLREEADRAIVARLAAEEGRADAEKRYAKEVPRGVAKDVVAAVIARLKDGVSADRLSFVIANAADQALCDEEIVRRRFIVQTPYTSGENHVVTFADNRIAVTGQGLPATSDAGQAEARFDPGGPVTAEFTVIDGEVTRAEGALPLRHSVVLGDREFRFVMTPADTDGFVVVSAQRCAYP